MKYLAVSNNNNYFAWAFFDNKMLHSVDKFYYKEYNPYKQTKEIYDYLLDIIEQYQIGIIVIKKVDIRNIKKEHLYLHFKIRSIIELLVAQKNLIYNESKIDGWELYITHGKNTTKRKLKIVNEGYDVWFDENEKNFLFDDVEIANAIILGEAVAHRRIHV